MSKANKSNNLNLPVLTKAINDNFPNLFLPFMEEGAGMFYSVVLYFQEMAFVNSDRFVLRGKLIISGGLRTELGCIEYNFSTGSFYRVKITRNGGIRRTRTLQIELDPDGKPLFDRLLTFMTDYLYSTEDCETNI